MGLLAEPHWAAFKIVEKGGQEYQPWDRTLTALLGEANGTALISLGLNAVIACPGRVYSEYLEKTQAQACLLESLYVVANGRLVHREACQTLHPHLSARQTPTSAGTGNRARAPVKGKVVA